MSLPVERSSVESRLCFSELAIEIMTEYAVDERARRNKEARKGSVEKVYLSILNFQSDIEERGFQRKVKLVV